MTNQNNDNKDYQIIENNNYNKDNNSKPKEWEITLDILPEDDDTEEIPPPDEIFG